MCTKIRSLRKKNGVFLIIVIAVVLCVTVIRTVNNINFISNSYKFVDDQISLKSAVTQNVLEKTTMIQNVLEKTSKSDNNNMKYILQWTPPSHVPFVYMGKEQQGFIDRHCPYTNCIVTGNRLYLSDYTKFDVIAFAGQDAIRLSDLPLKRSPHQKYAFATIESSDNYPVCSNKFDGYFNWTWTYKLDSEVQWGYFAVRDTNNKLVGPKKEMNWIKFEDMEPVSDDFKQELKTKTKAAAWLVSNCYTRSKRKELVTKLNTELSKYNMTVDIYGSCGSLKCGSEENCNKIIKRDYYFYLAFENSFSEDYVTEKLLHAVENDAVPIVYGGANYTRFLPDGVYLNARELKIEELAAKMNELINDPEKYAEHFKWKNHYSYHRQFESVDETDPYCLFCAHLNNKEMVTKTTIYKEFRKWWDPPGRC